MTPEQQAELASQMQALSLAIPAYERLVALMTCYWQDAVKRLRWTIKNLTKRSFFLTNN
jgi:hypothetical protein